MRRQYQFIIGALSVVAVLVAGVVGVFVLQGQDRGTNVTQSLAVTQPIAVLRTADYHSLVFSTNDSNVVFFGHHDGIMSSGDGGITWRSLVNRPNFDAMSLAVDYSDSRRMYLAGHDILQVSRDGGSTWSPMQNDLPGTDIHAFTISPDDPQRLFVFIYGNGFFRSEDGGLVWKKLSAQLPGDVMAVAVSGGNAETLYAASMMAGVFKSTDGGQSWLAAGKSLGSSSLMAIAVDTKAPETVYAGGKAGLFKSTDEGDSWTKLAFPDNNVAALAVSPRQPGLLLALKAAQGNGEVYRSKDGGLTWGR